MKTKTDTGSTITLLDRASFQLQNVILLHSYHYQLCILISIKEPALSGLKIRYLQRKDTLQNKYPG